MDQQNLSEPLRFHFSTEALPKRDRMALWREELGRKLLHIDVSPIDTSGDYLSEFSVLALPDLSITFGSYAQIKTQRTRELTGDGNDDFLFMIGCQGSGHIVSQGEGTMLHPGDAILMSNALVSTVVLPETSRFFVLGMPFKSLAPLVGNTDILGQVGVVHKADAAVGLLGAYVAKVFETDERELTPRLHQVAIRHILDLIAVTLGVTGDAQAIAQNGGIRAARLGAIKADIKENVGKNYLTVEWIAHKHRISTSYVQKLFHEEQTTFTQFLLEARLSRAHALLSRAASLRRTISDIALECGFGDLSYFNRSFRRRYGGTPSDIRAAAATKS